jgi:hypothetical protein
MIEMRLSQNCDDVMTSVAFTLMGGGSRRFCAVAGLIIDIGIKRHAIGPPDRRPKGLFHADSQLADRPFAGHLEPFLAVFNRDLDRDSD